MKSTLRRCHGPAIALQVRRYHDDNAVASRPPIAKQESIMTSSVNKVILVGNLGRDPEIRRTQDGRSIANLSVAWRDKATGERRPRGSPKTRPGAISSFRYSIFAHLLLVLVR